MGEKNKNSGASQPLTLARIAALIQSHSKDLESVEEAINSHVYIDYRRAKNISTESQSFVSDAIKDALKTRRDILISTIEELTEKMKKFKG